MTRILIVDDNDQVRRSVRSMLADFFDDLTVGEATGAVDALARVDRDPWDVVLLDLSLPDRRGTDLLRDIHRMRPALPVIVMSFHAEGEYAAAALAAGAASYLAKGSSPDVIARAIAGQLPGRGGGS
jgi:DNA-binding NarL/FixJ family response regulator